MKLSIIILNYNTKELTRNCINSILDHSDNYEIIIVDNNSGDDSVNYLENIFKDSISIIRNNKNLGFAAANNIGSKQASGDILLFLNSDTIVKENIFASIVKTFDDNERIGIVSPKIILSDGSLQDNSFGQYPTILNTILSKLLSRKNVNNKIKDNNKIKAIKNVNWVSGCCLFIRKNLFEQVNGFDANFFLYFEDVDLCKRVFNLDYMICIDNNSEIMHLGGKSIKKNSTRKKHYYKSQDYYFKKHLGVSRATLMKILRTPIKIIKS